MKRLLPLLLLSVVFVKSSAIHAQEKITSLIEKAGDEASSPQTFVEFNGEYLFDAYDPSFGRELWITDGTTANTRMVKDINPGPDGSLAFPGLSSVVKSGNKFYFVANDGQNDNQVWESDGTEAGTQMVAQFIGFNGVDLSLIGDKLFFMRWDKDLVLFDLMTLDLSTKTFEKVKEGLSGYSSFSYEGSHLGLYFFTFQATNESGPRLWRSDGTEAGTFSVTDQLDGVGIGRGTSTLSQYIEFDSKLYFIKRKNGNAVLMSSDGTSAGTLEVSTLASTSLIRYGDVLSHNGKLYFSFQEDDDKGLTIYESDGSSSTSPLLFSGTSTVPSNLVAIGDQLYITASADDSFSVDLIGIDLSTNSNTDLTNLSSSVSPRFFQDFLRAYVTQLSDTEILIQYLNDSYEHQSFVYNLSTQEKRSVTLSFSQNLMATSFGVLYVQAFQSAGFEPWIAGTDLSSPEILKNINTQKFGINSFSAMIALNDKVLFFGNDPDQGLEPHVYNELDGTLSVLSDLSAGSASSSVNQMIIFNSLVYFTSRLSDGSYVFVKTDGTTEGTETLGTYAGISDAPLYLTVFQGQLHAAVNSVLSRLEGDSFVSILDLKDSPSDRFVIEAMAATTDKLYFKTRNVQLWSSDGTADGTVNFNNFFDMKNIMPVGNQLFLTAKVSNEASEKVWRTDGTADGTIIVHDVENSVPMNLYGFNDQLFYSATNSTTGRELWTTDGTVEGTRMVKDIREGSLSGLFNVRYQGVGETLFFSANDGTSGMELWKTDGTSEGTVQVKDINTGSDSSIPDRFMEFNGLAVFQAFNPATGEELWVSDGTEAGTTIAYDLNSGINSSLPRPKVVTSQSLYFLADASDEGFQLWQSSDAPTFTIAALTALEEDFSGTQTITVTRTSDQEIGDYTLSPASTDFANLSFDATTGSLSITAIADKSGSQEFTITSTDGAGLQKSYSQQFTLTVDPVNDAPTFSIAGDLIADEDFENTLNLSVTSETVPADESSQTVTYSVSPASVDFANIGIDAQTGEITVSSKENTSGTQEFTITADDGQAVNNTASHSFTLTINPVNDPPAFTIEADITADEDFGTELSPQIIPGARPLDETDQVFTFSISPAEVDFVIISFDPQTGETLFFPVHNANGSQEFTITADDGQSVNNTTSRTFTLTINPVNDPPAFDIEQEIMLAEDFEGVSTFTPIAESAPTDEEDQTIVYSLSPESIDFADISIDSQTGTLSISSVANQFGSQELVLTANDGQDENNTFSKTITLEIAPLNDAPTIEMIDNPRVQAGQSISVLLVTADLDMDELIGSFNVSNETVLLPSEWTLIKEGNTLFRLNVSPRLEASGGRTPVSFSVSDGGTQATLEFDIIVEPADVVNIDNEQFFREISLYPNATSGLVNLEFTTNPAGTLMHLMGPDLKVHQQEILGESLIQQINLSNLPAGIYFIRLKDKQNRMAVKRVLKR